MNRVGIGYDIHQLTEERNLVLGGVAIPHCKGLAAHSDGDVVCHAIMDALLGAAALPNIGILFPDNDAQYKDYNSLKLLGEVVVHLADAGFLPVQVDTNIIAERPKLQPYLAEMRQTIARTLGIEENCVSLKPRTNEGFGPEGKEEAISAQAVVLIYKKA